MKTPKQGPVIPLALRAEIERVRVAFVDVKEAEDAVARARRDAWHMLIEMAPRLLDRMTWREAADEIGISTAAIWKVLERQKIAAKPAKAA